MDCLACGTPNHEESQQCSSCGAALVEVCGSCGAPVPVSSRFCGNCGARSERSRADRADQIWDNLSAPIRLSHQLVQRTVDTRALLEGERKQITVLFADIKGSTTLIENLDPEEAESRLRPALDAMINAVRRYEGTINRVQGDGIMALFGAPLAHEDNAVRAAYAALDIQKDVRATCTADISVRVGLHAGDVLVRAVHNDLSVDYDAVGATVHLAARMEQMAPPGTIYCTAEVMRMTTGFVTARPLGQAAVKGIRQPVDMFEIVGHTAARTRWEVTAARGLTPFVNREDERARLQRALELAAAGTGRLVVVKGQPGTGKSRLVHEFLQASELSGWLVLKTAATAYERGTPYLAISNLLRSWCGISEQAPPAEAKSRLKEALDALPGGSSIYVPALQWLLDLPVEDADWPALDAAERRQRMRATLRDLVLRCAKNQPLLLWFEDIQWTDVETRAVVDGLVELIEEASPFVLLTCRPEYEHKWDGKSFLTPINLEPLETRAAHDLVQGLVGDGNADLRALIVERTDGTPLFIEETIRTLVESGALRLRTGGYELTRQIPEIRIPETVQLVISARIDSLSPRRKTLLQVASVIGSNIPIMLLREVADLSETELQRLLAELKAAQFVYEAPNPIYPQLKFRHAMIHEIAYGSLTLPKRQTLHARVLRAMESQYRENTLDVVESLAHHAFNAALWDEARTYLCAAGDKAVEFSAYQAAVAFFESALQALAHLPQDHERLRQGIDIRLKLRPVFLAIADLDRLERYLTDAEKMAVSIGDQQRLAAIDVALALVHNGRGELEATIERSARARNVARTIGNVGLEIGATFYLGQAYMWRGDMRQVVAVLEDNMAWIDGPLRHQRAGTAGTSSVLWLGMLGASQGRLGNFAVAIETARRACEIADEVRRPADIAFAYWWAGFVSEHRGDIPTALQYLEHAFEVCRTSQINYLLPIVSNSLGHVYALAGRVAQAIPLLEKALAFNRGAKFAYGEAWSSVYLGFANLLDNRYEGMLDQARNILELARKHSYRAIEVDALRLLGDVHRNPAAPAPEEAERYYRQACDLSSELGLRPEYVRCQMALGQLLMAQGRLEEAERLIDSAIQLCRSLGMVEAAIDSGRAINLNSSCSGAAVS